MWTPWKGKVMQNSEELGVKNALPQRENAWIICFMRTKPFQEQRHKLLEVLDWQPQLEGLILQIRLSSEQSAAAPVAEHVRKVEAEVDVLKQLQHANIVRYLVRSRTFKADTFSSEAGVCP